MRAKRWAAKLLLVGLSIFFGLLLAEVGLRLAGYSYPYLYTFEDQTSWMHRPGTAGWFRKEGNAYVRINSAGLRDREHSKSKPPNTYRVAVLGDSFAEALQVPLEDTFWHLLETTLAPCPTLRGRGIEVINFGVSNYGTAQELLALRSRVWDYEPDLVVLLFTPANDVRNNSRALDQDELRPYFVLRGDDLVADMSFRDSAAFRQKRTVLNRLLYNAINYSRILQAINANREAYILRRKVEQEAANRRLNQEGANHGTSDVGGGTPAELGLEVAVYGPPPDEQWDEAWRVTEAILAQMSREVREHGARFLVAVGTEGMQVHPDPLVRQENQRRIGATDLFYPGRRLEHLGGREHFPFLDLAPTFQTSAEHQKMPLHGFDPHTSAGHWNQGGHRLASELLAQRICMLLKQ